MNNLALRGCALAAILFAATPAVADDARFLDLQYHADRPEPTIECPAGLICTVRLEPGERIRDGLNSQAGLWDPHIIYEGDGDRQVPILGLKPASNGLHANVVLTTSARVYYFLFESTTGSRPTYVTMRYDDDRHWQDAHHPRPRPTPPPAPPMTPSQLVDRACGGMHDTYRSDDLPAAWKPKRVCHDDRQTWIELTPITTVAQDLPVLHEIGPDGERLVNYQVFGRIYRVDGVGGEYVLGLGVGRGAVRMHIWREGSPGGARPAPKATPWMPGADVERGG